MSVENIRFLLSVEVNVTDAVSVQADQLLTQQDPATGELRLVPGLGQTIEEKVGVVGLGATMERLRGLPGVEVIAGQVLAWEKAEDGSFPEMRIPAMRSRAQLEQDAGRVEDQD